MRELRPTIRKAIKCGPVPVLRDWRSLPVGELTRAERVMRFCESMLRVPEGTDVGQPLRLQDFQEAFIYAVFDNPTTRTRRAIYSVGRKNGKSAVVACILLAFLIGPEAKRNTQLVCGAMSREQAAVVFRLACQMVQQSPKIRDLVKIVPSSKILHGLPLGTQFRAMAADSKTAMGISPRLVLLDEVGQISGPQSDFVDSLTTAQGAHSDALTIYISTQAATDADLLSILIDDAALNQPADTVCHLYTADKDADLMDEQAWRDSNPALGIFRDEQDLREQCERAKRMPSAEPNVRNLLQNQRVSVFAPFVSRDAWMACEGEPVIPPGAECYGGLDLSAVKDLTAFALVARVGDKMLAEVYAWMPENSLRERSKEDRVDYVSWAKQGWLRTCPGSVIDYEWVATDLAEILADRVPRVIAFDRWRIEAFKKAAESRQMAFPLSPYGQGFRDMAPAVDALEAMLLNGTLVHDANPVLRMCAANASVTQDPAGNRKFDKRRQNARIDMMVALAMAVGVAVGNGAQPEKPMDFGLMFSDPLVG